MPAPKDVFGANVARERQRQCKSMNALARIAGTHASEISRLERGHRDPRLWTMFRLARALDVPLTDLLDEVGPTPRKHAP
jgi:transcriptional regulator with XRE-family HTH domain